MAHPDRRTTLLDAYENAAVIVSGIDSDELGHPTPCPKYDVAGLIDHLVEAAHRAAALGAWLRTALKLREYPYSNIALDLADGPRRVDRIHAVGRASGVYENVVEPTPPTHGRLNPLRVAPAPYPSHEPRAENFCVTPEEQEAD
jgi:Mycothiol maleylpyruvate isomerase N-terminal domain